MPDERRIDEPVPTIVGPRPEGSPGGKVSVPQGIERLLTLAATNDSWKEKVLADPVAAAIEAGIGLSDSERSILRATPRSSLEQMTDSLAKRQGMSPLGKTALAVGVSAAALLAAGVAVPSMLASSRGIRPDVPPANPCKIAPEPATVGGRPLPEYAPGVIHWAASLEEALSEAKQERRAVMAVFPHPFPRSPKSISTVDDRPPAGSEHVPEWESDQILRMDSPFIRAEIDSAFLLPVRVEDPVLLIADKKLTEAGRNQHEASRASYDAQMKKYGLSRAYLPSVVFVAPDGSELSRLIQPQEEKQLLWAIRAVPAQLAKWYDERPELKGRDIISRPGVDVPLGSTAGIRIDIPPEKGK